MALADSMLKYGMKKIKMSQASNLGNTLSKIGDLGMEAGAALSKVAKSTETNRQAYETIQTGKKQVGIDDDGSFLERMGLKSSLSSDKTFDVKRDEGGINPRKISYDTKGLKQVGTLSSTYNNDYLVDKYGKDWEEKYGVSTNIRTPLEYREEASTFNPISQDEVDNTMKNYDARAKALEVPANPSAPINPNTGERFMTVEEGDAWDIKNNEYMQEVENKAFSDKAKTGEELGNKQVIAEQEGYANNLSIQSKNRQKYDDVINADKNEFLNSLKSTEGGSVNDEFFAKDKPIETYSDPIDDKKGKKEKATKLPSLVTKENQIEDAIINKFTEEDSPIIKEAPEDTSLKYKNMAKEKGLNFASSSIDKETGKTIYNLYNKDGKDLGTMFSMKNGKLTKENKGFFENMKHFKGLSWPKELYKNG